MSLPTYQVSDVANYLLATTDPEENDISNLKLQKLCYYAQGILTTMRGSPLFSDRIEAWDHGPVIPELYHKYKTYGSTSIPAVAGSDEVALAASDKQALRDIFDYYGQFSAWRLRNMTHDEPPWAMAYNNPNREISIESMIAHFRPIIDDAYISHVYGQGAGHQTA